MDEIGYAIIFVVDLLDRLTWLITDLLNEPIHKVLPRYRARCFFRDWNDLRVPRDHEWNCLVLDDLMDEYGHSAPGQSCAMDKLR